MRQAGPLDALLRLLAIQTFVWPPFQCPCSHAHIPENTRSAAAAGSPPRALAAAAATAHVTPSCVRLAVHSCSLKLQLITGRDVVAHVSWGWPEYEVAGCGDTSAKHVWSQHSHTDVRKESERHKVLNCHLRIWSITSALSIAGPPPAEGDTRDELAAAGAGAGCGVSGGCCWWWWC